MKTAILGGSFNPVHKGHISLAAEVVRQTPYERVLFIPAAKPPHKELASGADGAARVEMLEAALVTLSWAEVWDGELRRSGPSYSIDTVRQLYREGLIHSRPGLVIGDDLVSGFGHWHEVDELVKEVEIILARRSGGERLTFPYPCIRLDNELWPHSSTAVRELVASGGSLEEVLPGEVAAYVRTKGLYGYSD